MNQASKSILLIYTGGTIGMVDDPSSGTLVPLHFDNLREKIPELNRFRLNIDYKTVGQPVDSSEMNVDRWNAIGELIASDYEGYDGFVVLHGTDTMAYTASALSFMFENLNKPIILTGSQLPLGRLRTDGKENLISAIEIAATGRAKRPMINEVAVYFGSRLYRGNRVIKYATEDFDGVRSPNYPPLAEAGVHIRFNHRYLMPPAEAPMQFVSLAETRVALLSIFPDFCSEVVEAMLETPRLEGLIIRSYGTGNIPSDTRLWEALKRAKEKGVFIANITQCDKGFIEQGRYKTGDFLLKLGVAGGADMTTEAAIAKMKYLLTRYPDNEVRQNMFAQPLRGELTAFSVLD
jgi:L-asparaginase